MPASPDRDPAPSRPCDPDLADPARLETGVAGSPRIEAGAARRLQRDLSVFFARLGTPAHDRDDLVQETLARVAGLPARGTAPPRNLVAYARVVARNLWRDLLRCRARGGPSQAVPQGGLAELERWCPPADPAADPAAAAARAEELARIRQALPELSPRHRRTLELILLEGQTYAQAAATLGTTTGTIKSRVHYAVRSLRRRLAEGSPDEPRPARGRLVSGEPPDSGAPRTRNGE